MPKTKTKKPVAPAIQAIARDEAQHWRDRYNEQSRTVLDAMIELRAMRERLFATSHNMEQCQVKILELTETIGELKEQVAQRARRSRRRKS